MHEICRCKHLLCCLFRVELVMESFCKNSEENSNSCISTCNNTCNTNKPKGTQVKS